MRRVLATVSATLLAACGGLENVPLTRGVVRGMLVGANAQSLVAVIGQPELYTHPDAQGEFTIADVPQGDVELLLLANSNSAARQTVTVTGGGVSDLGPVQGRPPGFLEIFLRLPHFISAAKGRVGVLGTPLTVAVDPSGKAEFRLPEGCYVVRGAVPGLAAVEREVCLEEGRDLDVELELPEPDGSKGHEGCGLAGCLPGTVCKSNGRCELP
jgi:hypothetical protein